MRSTYSYRIKTIKTLKGERIPVLVVRDTGLPSWYPNLYSIKIIRNKNRSSNTMEAGLRALMGLHSFLDAEDINIDDRLDVGKLLTMQEVSMLTEYLRESRRIDKAAKIVNFDRRGKKYRYKEVSNETFNTRLALIADYIGWRCEIKVDQHLRNGLSAIADKLMGISKSVVQRILSYRVSIRSYNTINEREGLSENAKKDIASVIDPKSGSNPWKSASIKDRNYLIYLMPEKIGIRRGELLNIRISDINFKDKTLMVPRRADAIDDPRVNQPKAKTRDRMLPLTDDVIAYIHNYIVFIRSKIKHTQSHDYLFVSHATGMPLSMAAVNKIFRQISYASNQLVSPHVLRHTWNDNFSKKIDSENAKSSVLGNGKCNRISPEMEKKIAFISYGMVRHI